MSTGRPRVGLARVSRARLAAVGAVLALGAAACGSSNSTSSGTVSSPSTTSGGAAGSSVSTAVANAKAAVEKLSIRPSTLEVPALPSKPAPGKTIDFIACGVPACQEYIPILRQATDALGWKLKAVNSGVTPQSVAAAYDQAVRDKPAGVIGSGGVSPDVFAKQLAQLKDLGVPVVLQVVPASTLPGLTAIVYGEKETKENGQQMADYILADSGGKDVHLGIVSTPGTPVYAAAHVPLTQAVSAASCTSCSVKTFSFPITDLGPDLPSKVVSFVRANPDVNYLFFDFVNETDGVPAALQRAGLGDKIKIVTIDIQSTQAAYITSGQNLVATAANPWPEILWAEAGIIATISEGGDSTSAAAVKLPEMTLTKDNLIDSAGQPYFPLVADYQAIFKKAWQVS